MATLCDRRTSRHEQARSALRKAVIRTARRRIDDVFAKQGFASRELVTRWTDIVGAEIAAHSEPMKSNGRAAGENQPEPATLVLRVEGPMALEIQHTSDVILERVNRFFGWQAVGRIALRQAPLSDGRRRKSGPKPDAAEVAKLRRNLDRPWKTASKRGAGAARSRRSSKLTVSARCRRGPALPHSAFKLATSSISDLAPFCLSFRSRPLNLTRRDFNAALSSPALPPLLAFRLAAYRQRECPDDRKRSTRPARSATWRWAQGPP